ncbi:diacylglycerol/lipid kinase family protein [Occultella glacieicola]|uniref:diacylglycerol/lipid kinase family protein n=1 Tax=Occultella glacieicola TaxID=2518684 RepID=UPI001F15D1D5|nr:diacylglycerol kinase family protein [Occultella glacieicola]
MTNDPAHDLPESEEVARLVGNAPRPSAVIVNPHRLDDIERLRRTISTTLTDADWPEPLWLETTEDDPGTGQAREAVADGAEVVFVSGGDGTVRACVEGLAGSDAALAILPGGTGNLLAGNFAIPTDPADGVRLAIAGGRRRIDVGEVGAQVFAVMAGMGFDAKMLDSASTELKARIGAPAYVVSAMKHLFDHPMRVQVVVDDAEPLDRRARSVIVGNVGQIQAGVALFPDAEPDDGYLDVAILAPRHLGHWVSTVAGVLTRRKRVPNLEILRGKRVRVRSTQAHDRELDGDVIEPGHELLATIRPACLWICVPTERPTGGSGARSAR